MLKYSDRKKKVLDNTSKIKMSENVRYECRKLMFQILAKNGSGPTGWRAGIFFVGYRVTLNKIENTYKNTTEREELLSIHSLCTLPSNPFTDRDSLSLAYDHTTLKARHPVRSAKLSNVGSG